MSNTLTHHSNALIQFGNTSALLFALLAPLILAQPAQGQTSQRWFQIEVSVFSNENFNDRNEELWEAEHQQLEYPNPLHKLGKLSNLLLTDALIADAIASRNAFTPAAEELNSELDEITLESTEKNTLATILANKPQPYKAPGDFRLFDLLRDARIQLGTQDSNFQQTNRALQRSANHRLLFHALWREPVAGPDDAIPLYVQGGSPYGDQHELQGSITLRFNNNYDRIVIDTNLWLTEFSIAADNEEEWQLPEIPEQIKSNKDLLNQSTLTLDFGINRIFHMQQSRDMRSKEFHYLDHPALGLVILVEPYEVPPLPAEEPNIEE